MLRSIPLLLCLSSPTSFEPTSIEYVRYHLFELAASAERVVYGSIVGLQAETFDLAVERELVGGSGATALHLKRFQDWTCAMRWDEYRVGQRVVLFLDGERAMGAGDEGDWPMVGDQVLAPFQVHGLEWNKRSEGEKELAGSALALDELERGLNGYRRVFRASTEHTPDGDRLRVDFSLDEAAAQQFARTSPLARELYEETRSSPAFLVLAPSPIPPGLSVEPVVRVRNGAVLGDQLVSPGDLDGDGWDDLAALDDYRKLRIVLLDPTGRARSTEMIEPDVLGVPDLWFAEGLAAIGDCDGDGVPDLAVGAPAKEKGRPGRVGLLFLARDGSVRATRLLESETLAGARPGFGASLTAAGDVDGNGASDLLVGVSRMFDGFDFDPAALLEKKEPALYGPWLVFLEPDGGVRRATELPARDFLAGTSDVTFCRSLATVGDLDGDGLPELALGYPYDGDGGEERGALWIAFLGRDGALRAKTKISDWSGGFEALLLDGDEFGETLAAPGDLDGDGVPDLVVGGAKELWFLSLQRDGSVRSFRTLGARAGGFVPLERIRSLALLHGPEQTRQLVVGGTSSMQRQETAIWVLKLGAGGVLSAP